MNFSVPHTGSGQTLLTITGGIVNLAIQTAKLFAVTLVLSGSASIGQITQETMVVERELPGCAFDGAVVLNVVHVWQKE